MPQNLKLNLNTIILGTIQDGSMDGHEHKTR